MIGKVVTHYKILEKLGEGGMDVVYKTHDTTLGRDVVLKFLAHSLKVSDNDQFRFLQEARAAALLNHPNICTIHDVLELNDQSLGGIQSVIVMEYVDGKSLRDMLPVGNLKQATELGTQIASGLAAAHEKGSINTSCSRIVLPTRVNTRQQSSTRLPMASHLCRHDTSRRSQRKLNPCVPLSPGRKSLTTTPAVRKRVLWILEGFPAPETLW